MVKYKEWKIFQEEHGQKRRKLLTPMEDSKNKFCEEFKKRVKELKSYTEKVHRQYEKYNS